VAASVGKNSTFEFLSTTDFASQVEVAANANAGLAVTTATAFAGRQAFNSSLFADDFSELTAVADVAIFAEPNIFNSTSSVAALGSRAIFVNPNFSVSSASTAQALLVTLGTPTPMQSTTTALATGLRFLTPSPSLFATSGFTAFVGVLVFEPVDMFGFASSLSVGSVRSPENILKVLAESRVLLVHPESWTVTIDQETRIVGIRPENRTIGIDQETRTLHIQGTDL
jgi:hypothetical protein